MKCVNVSRQSRHSPSPPVGPKVPIEGLKSHRYREVMSDLDHAVSLPVAERRAVVQDFFFAHPGDGREGIGFGRAVADFLDWEVASERVVDGDGGSCWWKAVNGFLVLDLTAAIGGGMTREARAWRDYATGPAADQQGRLWHAHGLSIERAVGVSRELAANEPAPEREFIGIVLAALDHAGLVSRSTDDATLATAVERHYPMTYPIAAEELERLRDFGATTESGSGRPPGR